MKKETTYTEDELWNLLVQNTNVYLDWFDLAIKNPTLAMQNKPSLLNWFNENKKK